MRYTIRRNGAILGTYDGVNEAAALDTVSVEEGYDDFQASCQAMGLVRDNYTVTLVEE